MWLIKVVNSDGILDGAAVCSDDRYVIGVVDTIVEGGKE